MSTTIEGRTNWTVLPVFWANGDSKVDYVSQWTLEGFPQPWSKEINSMAALSKAYKKYPQNMLYISDPRMTQMDLPHSWVLMW